MWIHISPKKVDGEWKGDKEMQRENTTLFMSLPTVVLQSFLQLILSETLTAGFAGTAGQIST